MSLAKEFIEARDIKIPTDVKQLVKIMHDYASMMVQLEKEAIKALLIAEDQGELANKVINL